MSNPANAGLSLYRPDRERHVDPGAAAESAQTAKQSQFGGPIPRHLANVG